MLTLTDAASAHLNSALCDAPEGAAIRFVQEGQSYQPCLDEPREGDTAYKHDERVVLLVDPTMAEAFANCVLDVQATDGVSRLVLAPAASHEDTPDASE